MKRSLDIVTALVALLLLSPLMLVLAVLIRCRLGTPVLFRQVRPGLHGRPFEIIKFRTMRDAFDADSKPLPDEVRITRLGRIIRATSLDELPELWNVLIGDMSLVGPRPLCMEYLPLYNAEQARRQHVRPGITGWAQINGRNGISWERKFELDVWYVDNHSLWLDMRILLTTVYVVITGSGVSSKDHVTMEDFKGSR